MDVPNLRSAAFIGKPKDVEDTNMLDTEARETPETVSAKNELKEEVVTHPPFGPLGAMGRR